MLTNSDGIVKSEVIHLVILFLITLLVIGLFSVAGKNYLGSTNSAEINTISCEVVFNSTSEKEFIFIDARDKRFYNYGHIKNAISLPYTERHEWRKSELMEIDKNLSIVVYCSSSRCSLSKRLAKFLYIEGFTNIYALSGGIDEWQSAGYPVER